MVRDFIAPFRKLSLAFAVVVAIGTVPIAACGVKGPLNPAQPSAPAAGALPSEPPTAPATQSPERKP